MITNNQPKLIDLPGKDEGVKNDGSEMKLNLNNDALRGMPDHKNILQRLLSELKPVDFREVIGLPSDEHLKQKHILVAVVKHLLQIAKAKQWNLCRRYDYTYIYNGSYWKQCSKDDIKKFLSDVAVNMGYPEYDAKHYDFAEKLLKQFLSDAHLPAPAPDPNKVLINLSNGTFEFTPTGWEQREFKPDDFLTYQLPFMYDKEATCALFDKYLLKVLPDESSRMVLQEFAGFIFTKLNFEKCLVLTGSGGNGKSVYFNILNALVGKDNTLNYSLGYFNHEYNRAKLTNILLNYCSEKGFDLNPDIFKTLISGEQIQAREVYGKPFTIHNSVKFIINCNELPRETESTEAFFRRFIIVPFDVKISEEEKDIDLANKIIESELPGVFNWVLDGLNRIVKQNHFTPCQKSERALGEFRKQGDSVQLFIEEHSFQPSEGHKVTLNDIYKDYKSFCGDDGYKALGKNKFSQRLESKGFEKMRRNDGNYFGIAIKGQ